MRFDDSATPRIAPQETHTIIEKGMSPAEAVKLVAEFEKVARDKIIGSYAVENQLLNGQVFIERDEAMRRQLITFKMRLNGRDRVIATSLSDFNEDELAERTNALREELAKKMVEVLIDELSGPIVAALHPRGI